MTHRIREQTNNQTISRRKHNIITLTIGVAIWGSAGSRNRGPDR